MQKAGLVNIAAIVAVMREADGAVIFTLIHCRLMLMLWETAISEMSRFTFSQIMVDKRLRLTQITVSGKTNYASGLQSAEPGIVADRFYSWILPMEIVYW